MAGYKHVEAMLYDYPLRKKQIEINRLKIRELELRKTELGAVVYDGIKVETSNISNTTEKEAIELYQSKEVLNKKIEKDTLFCKRIETAMSTLGDTERLIVEGKYFEGMRDYEVYRRCGVSKSGYYRLKRGLIEKIGRIINE
ncbi:hypothetical protein ANASTE_00705 [Anaerofustis stercorihominis DSM 17244]|uniref:Phage transcriptional regulator, RinA family n=1 Tax=Anaerofustis stercorihominis DSM 17244 TaxID=445971 RepID=B1C7K3_9FIRM|nr:hypothetical protein [Anaerofustis stercorihominis]EDS72990.1 hypothetical protein ANASTE_00705 [Anaerofustis stercorihominis DSM 17244]